MCIRDRAKNNLNKIGGVHGDAVSLTDLIQIVLGLFHRFFPGDVYKRQVLGLVQRYDFTGLDISANNIMNGSYVMPETSRHPAALFDHVDKGELGIKTGKGFYDYGGRSREELCAKRDKLLFQVLRATKDLINERI